MPCSKWQHRLISRRQMLAEAAVAGAPCRRAFADTKCFQTDNRPGFSRLGPNADRYGAAQGFPARRPIEQAENRVGGFSHCDELFPTRRVERASTSWEFVRSAAAICSQAGHSLSLADYVARNPITGLLIARGDQLFFEHYNYGRTDHDRLMSRSMAKTIVGLLIGIAISEGAIQSVNDTADTFVSAFKGTEYGATPLRDLLHKSSGVAFGEEADDERDLKRLFFDMMGAYLPQYDGIARGTVGGILRFNTRVARPGTRFSYASIEADVLSVVLHHAVGRSASAYLQEKIWQPVGTEADAKWVVDPQGFKIAHGFFNAVLRDYARLARLLAQDGVWNGKQIVPVEWMIEATTVRSGDGYLAPGRADPYFGYGYLLWLFPGPRRQFALLRDFGQRICVDPLSGLVLVQTAVEQTDEV